MSLPARSATDVTLVLDGDRVGEVRDGVNDPDGNHLDLTDCTVAPGLIDLHTHLDRQEENGSYGDILMESQADDALIGVKNARSTIDVGFTTVRDVGIVSRFHGRVASPCDQRRLGRRPAYALRRCLHHVHWWRR